MNEVPKWERVLRRWTDYPAMLAMAIFLMGVSVGGLLNELLQ